MNFETPAENPITAEAGDGALSWQEPFEWEEPKEWHEALDLIELSGKMLADGRIESAMWLQYNRMRAKEIHGWQEALHTPPAAEHYRHTYLWDSGFFEIIYSQAALFAGKAAQHLEEHLHVYQAEDNIQKISSAVKELRDKCEQFKRAAIEETFWVLNFQKPNGFIANLQYAKGFKWYEVEKIASNDKVHRSSNYSQPPVLPLAAVSTYKSLQELGDPTADLYLEQVYQPLKKLIDFWNGERSNSPDDRLIGVIDPHETGLDSLEQWDYDKLARRERDGAETPLEIDERNRFADGAHQVFRMIDNYLFIRGDPEKARAYFWANDVMINSIYQHNIQVLAWMAGEMGIAEDASFYEQLALEVEQAILDKMWYEDPAKVPKPGFYSLNSEEEPIPTITISNLFSLTLPHLPGDKLRVMLDIMDDDFDVPYPLPSCSKHSKNFDPHNQEKDRLWRGPTWLNTNYYIADHGLSLQAKRAELPLELRQRCASWALRLAEASNKLLDINQPQEPALEELLNNPGHDYAGALSGAYEHFNPLTGQGQRERVRNFGWSHLARYMLREYGIK